MFQTTIAYVADHFGKFFFGEFDDWKKRVVYGDNDSYFKHLGEAKLDLPGMVFTLTQLNLLHGPSRPTRFRRDDFTTDTKTLVYNTRPALLTFSMALYCQDAMQSFDLLQKYCEVQSSGAIRVRYWTDSMHCVDVDCSMTNFEDPSIEPAGKKSEDYDSTGLIYEIEGGFSVYTFFLVPQERRILRCIKYNHYLVPYSYKLDNTNIGTGLYMLGEQELTDTPQYVETLRSEGLGNGRQ